MERTLKNTDIPYRIRLSKRAIYARISASHKGIEVTIPEDTPIAYAEKFAEKKGAWITSKHKELSQLKEKAKIHLTADTQNTTTAELKRQLKVKVKDIIIRHHIALGRPKQLRIKEQSSRWGSCSSKGGININWKLIFAPEHVLEYVVVHELCHMTHMNHSKDFWNLVEDILPEYIQAKHWLKTNGQVLMSTS
ncbi:MAG: putative metal-dependent hydrolase [Alphaproteobacteria bacterium]|jgi:predicted metal-dependent hydrolase